MCLSPVEQYAGSNNDGKGGSVITALRRLLDLRRRAALDEELPGYGHLRCLLTPFIALAFFTLQPRQWWLALAFVAATFVIDLNAEHSPDEKRQPPVDRDAKLFNALLYLLFVIYWVNLALALRMVADVGWVSVQAPAALVLVVLSSSLMAIAAHELIHRRGAREQWMGRLLLCSFFFEHFATEHLRTHHSRVATADDPATARFGEAFWPYLLRNLPAQFVSAWRLGSARCKDRGPPMLRAFGNPVLQGLLVEAALLGTVSALFGWRGLALLLLNAAVVAVIVHAVSYFQHWGLERDGVSPGVHSWDTANRSNLFSMFGMARHADHHLHPNRPYHLLRYVEGSPKLPRAYGGMIWLAVMNNSEFQQRMAAALRALNTPLRTSAESERSSWSAR